MEYAVALNYRDDNPCSRIGPVLGPQQDLVQHMRALPHRDTAAAVAKVRASKVIPAVKLAFEFLVLTAARSGEVRGARWDEMDTADHVWTVPATRTKAKREHRVPLTRRAEQILDAARAAGNGGPLVFPSARGKRINDTALSGLLRTLEIPAVPHGFRSTFRDWAAEETNHPREVVEAALAHVVQNKVEAAYARSDLFERRRQLMDDWTAYVVDGTGEHRLMVAHLRDRADALVRVGWTRREAEWLALVCLHSGVFLRSQYLAFIGRMNPALAHRFVRRCRKYAVEEPWNGSRLRVCRIAARRLYGVIDAEHVRHRRPAAFEVVLRRLLSLDYVLEHAHAPWLPTEDEKVNALTAAGIAKELLPRRLYRGALGGRFR